MLLELIATCIIGTGGLYTPPAGWQLTAVTFAGRDDHCTYEPGASYGSCLAIMPTVVENNTVTLRKTVEVGEKVTAPERCVLTSELKSDVLPSVK